MFLPILQHILSCYVVHVSPRAPRVSKAGSAENQWEAKKEYPFEVKLNYAVSDWELERLYMIPYMISYGGSATRQPMPTVCLQGFINTLPTDTPAASTPAASTNAAL